MSPTFYYIEENLNSIFYVEYLSISVQIPHWSFHYSEKLPSKKLQYNTNFTVQEIVIKRISMILFNVLSNVGAVKWQTFSTVFTFQYWPLCPSKVRSQVFQAKIFQIFQRKILTSSTQFELLLFHFPPFLSSDTFQCIPVFKLGLQYLLSTKMKFFYTLLIKYFD